MFLYLLGPHVFEVEDLHGAFPILNLPEMMYEELWEVEE